MFADVKKETLLDFSFVETFALNLVFMAPTICSKSSRSGQSFDIILRKRHPIFPHNSNPSTTQNTVDVR